MKFEKDEIVDFADQQILVEYNKLERDLKSLNKNSLLRLLKVASGINEAEKLLGKNNVKLNEQEEEFINKLMRLQENVVAKILSNNKEKGNE